ncbi:MAG: hypothetical protein K8R53_10400, partial [Bacteroidales bacterium]|nr:hypothetical protein [Bacteroidales bacterium]
MAKLFKILLTLKLSIVVLHAIGQFQVIKTGTNETIKSVNFLNNTTGYIAGTAGLLSMTQDGGETWQEIVKSTEENFNDICFTDDQTGFVVGDNSTFLFTKDGGLNWSSIKSHKSGDLIKIRFISDSCGFVLGRSKKESYLLRTTDAGKNWKTISLFIENNNVGHFRAETDIIQLNDFSFLNESTGLVGGYVLYGGFEKKPLILKTKNGGLTFEMLKTSGEDREDQEIISLDFQTPNDAYALKGRKEGKSSLYAADYWIEEFYSVDRPDDKKSSEIYFSSLFIDRFIGYITSRVNGKSQILKT